MGEGPLRRRNEEDGRKARKVPQAKHTQFFQKESHMPDHLAPGIDHRRSGSQVKMVLVTEHLWMIKRPPAQKPLVDECT